MTNIITVVILIALSMLSIMFFVTRESGTSRRKLFENFAGPSLLLLMVSELGNERYNK